MSLNNNNPFAGKRYIALVRASDDTQGDSSTLAQLDWMHGEGRRLEMPHVGDEIVSGVTGSLPGRRQDLERLLRRRAEQRDFEVLLIQRCDRLSRGGGAHTRFGLFTRRTRSASSSISPAMRFRRRVPRSATPFSP